MKKQLISLFVCLILYIPAYAKEAAFCSNQILAQPITNGYTWTLASRLGELLLLAEKDYGPRDKNWTILGVEFTKTKQPKIWYPFGMDKRNIIIQITEGAANNKKEMLFQLAHEVFHTLTPAGLEKTNVLEEGLATHFSIRALRELGIDTRPDYIATRKYRKAYNLIEELYKAQPDANQRIKEFRQTGEIFPQLTSERMLEFFPNIDKSLAIELSKRF